MFSDIDSVREYLNKQNFSVFDLDAINGLMDELNHPENDSKVIHITGTNGKGSTGAYIANILIAGGYNVGSFSSPKVFDDNEIIKMNDMPISDEIFIDLFNRVMDAADTMHKKGIRMPTQFEIETAMAYLYFSESKVDFSVVEVGMGGANDSTNIVRNTLLEVVTRISYDHMGILGNTLKEIAEVKSGIIKPNSVVVTTGQDSEVIKVLRERCASNNARLVVAGDGTKITECEIPQIIGYKGREYATYLLGNYQLYNLPIAIECARELRRMGYTGINDESVMLGVQNTTLSGRFEFISKNPYFVLDGAHNDEASARLADSIRSYFKDRKIIYLMGIFKDKDYTKIMDNTIHLADEVITFDWDNPRHLSGKTLKELASKHMNNVKYGGNIASAVRMALEDSERGDVIIAFGSLSHLAEIKRTYKGVRENG